MSCARAHLRHLSSFVFPRLVHKSAFAAYFRFSFPPLLQGSFAYFCIEQSAPFRVPIVLCGKRDLNPYGVNHTPLKRARLPVPPLPRILCGTWRNFHAHSREYCAGRGGTFTLTPANMCALSTPKSVYLSVALYYYTHFFFGCQYQISKKSSFSRMKKIMPRNARNCLKVS